MNNLALGIPAMLLSLIAFFYGWRYHQKDNYRVALLLLVGGGILLRIFVSADMFLHPWDERYHALVAKNLIEHPLVPSLYRYPLLDYDYKSWINNHVWLHKQPLALWCMAGSMRVFGVNEIALRLPSVIFSTLAILLVFSVGRYFFNRKVAFFGSFLMAINGMVIELAGGRIPTDHVDIAFMFFVLLSIYLSILFVRTRSPWMNILTGLCVGAAILTKWLPALIVVPVWILIVLDSGKFRPLIILLHLSVLIFFAALVSMPWQWYIYHAFPLEAAWESHYNLLHLSHEVEGRGGAFWFYLDKMRINYNELIYLPLIWFIWRSFKEWRNLRLMAVMVWMIIPLVFFSLVGTKMQAYILFISPALFLITGGFFFWLAEYRKRHTYKWLTGLLLILLVALPVRHAIERIKPFNIMDRHPVWVKQLKALDLENIRNGVLFNYHRPIEAMFYTDLIVYPDIPEADVLKQLMDEGYILLINKDEDVPEKVLNMEEIKFIHLDDDD